MDAVIFLPISIVSLYLLIFLAETLLEISRRALQKHARAHALAFPANSQMFYSHRSRPHDDVFIKRHVPVDGVNLGVIKYTSKVKEVVECAFCLSNVEEGDEIRELKCEHLFHRACLDKWLIIRTRPATCPLCRGVLLPPEVAPQTEEHMENAVDDGDEEEKDDSLIILFSYVDANGWFPRIHEKLRTLWIHVAMIGGE